MTTTTAPTAEPTMTGQEVANSLNGFEELAIKQAFGLSLEQLDALQTTRSLVFTLLMRTGSNARDAYMGAMNAPQSEVKDYFADGSDDAEVDDRDPMAGDESPAGKGSPPSETPTTSSPSSA